MPGSAGSVARGNAARAPPRPYPPGCQPVSLSEPGPPILSCRGRASGASSSPRCSPRHQDPAFLCAHRPPFALPSPPVGERTGRHRGVYQCRRAVAP